MKNKLFLKFSVFLLLIFGWGCDNPPDLGGLAVPTCDFSSSEQFPFENFGLKLPSQMSSYFYQVFPYTQEIYNLNSVLETSGDWDFSKNIASVSVNMTSNGDYCNGENYVKYGKNDTDHVLPNSLILPVPEEGFYGEIDVTIRTDDFREYLTNDPVSYVRWRVVTSDSNFLDGDILGYKYTYNPDTSAIILPGDEPIYDGTCGCYALPSNP